MPPRKSPRKGSSLVTAYRQTKSAPIQKAGRDAPSRKTRQAKLFEEPKVEQEPKKEIITVENTEECVATEGPLELNEAEETVLRKFDLAGKFGPCSSMSRSERFARAEKLGLSPPEEVRTILEKLGGNQAVQRSIWHGRL